MGVSTPSSLLTVPFGCRLLSDSESEDMMKFAQEA